MFFALFSAIKQINNAINLIKQIEISVPKECTFANDSNYILIQRNIILGKALNAHLNWTKQNPSLDLFIRAKKHLDEVDAILKLLSGNIRTSLCDRNNIYKIPDVEPKINISICNCVKGYCVDHINCSHICKRQCWEKYVLTRWICSDPTGYMKSFSLDALCDGKADCVDKTDELGCVTGIYELFFDEKANCCIIKIYLDLGHFDLKEETITIIINNLMLTSTNDLKIKNKNNMEC